MPIKAILGKIFSGILHGVGFVIGAALLASVLLPYFESSPNVEPYDYEALMPAKYDESAGLEVSVTSESIGDGGFNLIGELLNNGENSWSMVQLRAELYDESHSFIDECIGYVRDISKPGSSVNFKVSCGSKCAPIGLDGYAGYKLKVVNAYSEK